MATSNTATMFPMAEVMNMSSSLVLGKLCAICPLGDVQVSGSKLPGPRPVLVVDGLEEGKDDRLRGLSVSRYCRGGWWRDGSLGGCSCGQRFWLPTPGAITPGAAAVARINAPSRTPWTAPTGAVGGYRKSRRLAEMSQRSPGRWAGRVALASLRKKGGGGFFFFFFWH